MWTVDEITSFFFYCRFYLPSTPGVVFNASYARGSKLMASKMYGSQKGFGSENIL